MYFGSGVLMCLMDFMRGQVNASSHAQWTKGRHCVFFDNKNKKHLPVSFRPFNKKMKRIKAITIV